MNRLRQRLSRQEGFTLVEMLVVVAIIAILLAVAVPSYRGLTDRARDTTDASNARTSFLVSQADALDP